MDFPDYGAGLPIFIVITAFFSYLIWGKFLYRGREKRKIFPTIDEFVEISCIFFFMLSSSLALLFFIYFTESIFLPGLQIDFFLKILNYLLPTFVALLTVGFLLSFKDYALKQRKKESDCRLEYFEKHLIRLIKVDFVFIILLLASSWFVSQTVLNKYVGQFAILAIVVAIILGFSIIIIIHFCLVSIWKSNLKKKRIKDDLFIARNLLWIIAFLLISLAVLSMATPHTKLKQETEGYQMYNPHNINGDSFSVKSVFVNVTSFGASRSVAHHIEVPLDRYKFNTTGSWGDFFNIYVESTQYREPILLIDSFRKISEYSSKEKKFGITGLTVNRGILSIKFDRKKVLENGVTGFLLKGYSEINTNGTYKFTPDPNCTPKGCSVTIDIFNNLSRPVTQNKAHIHNLNSKDVNSSTCRFHHIDSNMASNSEYRTIGYSCEERMCQYGLENLSNYPILDAAFEINEHNHTYMTDLKMHTPLNISLNLQIYCD